MSNHDAVVLWGMTVLVAVASMVFYFSETPTGQASFDNGQHRPGFVQYAQLAAAPYTDLPYNGQPLDIPFAGRCYRDEGNQVVYATVTHQDVGRLFDGCQKAGDGEFYFYDYYCVGTDMHSQVWLRISHGC